MNIIYRTVFLIFCTTGIAYAGSTTGLGDTRTEACSQAKNTVSNQGNTVTSSCDCSKTSYDGWVCAVDHSRSNKRSYSNSSSGYTKLPPRSNYISPGFN